MVLCWSCSESMLLLLQTCKRLGASQSLWSVRVGGNLAGSKRVCVLAVSFDTRLGGCLDLDCHGGAEYSVVVSWTI